MKFFVSFILCIFLILNYSSAQINAGEDQMVCDSGAINLSAEYIYNVGSSTYSIESIPIDLDPINLGTTINNLTDDSYSEVIDLGFDFCFYGNVYNQLIISTNNYLCFDINQSGAYSSWQTTAYGTIQTPSVTNSILAPWLDLDPNSGGNLSYNTFGTAPNRRFVVSFNDFGYFSCYNMQFDGQIKIFETSNKIEIHIQNQPVCTEWNNGQSVLGLVNEDGSEYIIQDGWNNTQMNGDNEAFRFLPNTVIEWFDESGNFVGNGLNINVSPSTTTEYKVVASNCLEEFTDEVTVFVSSPVNVNPVIDDNQCPGEIYGGIEINALGGTNPLSYSWTNSFGSFISSEKNLHNILTGNYFLEVSDSMGCVTNFGPYTINPTPQIFEFDILIDSIKCFGFNDGAIHATISGGTPPYNYTWSGENLIGNNTQASINNLVVGEYQIKIVDNNGCKDSSMVYLFENNSITIDTILSNYNHFNISCFNGNDGEMFAKANGGAAPYSYFLIDIESGDTISENSEVQNLKSGEYSFITIDAEGCAENIKFKMTEPDSLYLKINAFSHESCTYNNDGLIEISSQGGPDYPLFSQNYLPILLEWTKENSSFYSNQKNIYNLESGNYTIKVTDANKCTNTLTKKINQPPFVIAKYRTVNDEVTINYPIVNLYDDSEGNIVKWYWELSNGVTSTSENIYNIDLSNENLDSLSVINYDLKLIVIDEFNCIDSTYGSITIKDEHTLYVPNGFTPNKDGKNDFFKLEHHGIKKGSFNIDIYDRWGAKIFNSANPNFKWDGTSKSGKDLTTGSYTYNLSYRDFENKIYDKVNCISCSGTLTLLR